MHTLIAVISVLAVAGLALWGIHTIFGEFSWVVYCVGGFFAFMAMCAKFNATS